MPPIRHPLCLLNISQLFRSESLSYCFHYTFVERMFNHLWQKQQDVYFTQNSLDFLRIISYIVSAKIGDTKMNPSSLKDLAKSLSHTEILDIDSLKIALEKASKAWSDQLDALAIYEAELQKEVQSRAEMCGISQTHLDQMFHWPLRGQALLALRREISRMFEERFKLAPMTGTARQTEETQLQLESWARFQSGIQTK